MIGKFAGKVAARAVDEGDAIVLHDAKVFNPWLVVNMTERVEDWLDSLFSNHSYLPEDYASTRILRKLGFEHRGTVHPPDDGNVWEWELVSRQNG